MKDELVVEVPSFKQKGSVLKRKGVGRSLSTSKKLKRVAGKIKPRKVSTKKPKVRTNLSLADEKFSKKILERDGKCLFPNCTSPSKLTNSHYHNRGKFNTRFDEKNCITLCQFHHYMNRVVGWEFQKQRIEKHGWDGQYTLFMKKWLGEEEFEALDQRAKRTRKQSLAIQAFMETVENSQKQLDT
jgi:hypothetical protein